MTIVLKSIPLEQLVNYCRAVRDTRDEHLLHDQLRWLLGAYPFLDFLIWHDRGVWRARKCDSPDGYPRWSDAGEPPPHLTKAGRLNEEGKPILYASLYNRVALREVGAKRGDYIQLVNYDIDPKQKLRCCVIGELDNVHRTGRSWVTEDLGRTLNGLLNRIPHREASSIVYLDAFMGHILCDTTASATDYLHSRTLASFVFELRPEIDAIIYPSVAVNGGRNLAIKPGVAARALKLSSAFVIQIDFAGEYGITEFRAVRTASAIGTEPIVWVEPNENQ